MQNNIGINILNYKIFNGKYVVKEKGNISTWEAITLYGETRLSSVIYNLREQGWKIQTLQEQSFDNEGESVRYGRYILEWIEGEIKWKRYSKSSMMSW